MLKLKLQYFDHLIQRAVSLKKTLMLGETEGRKRIVSTLQARTPKSRRWQGSAASEATGKSPSSPPPASGAAGVLWLVPLSLQAQLPPSHGLLVTSSLCIPYKDSDH